jgi:3-hydroxyacyl-[acyl-carrier-protein] dehydratase
MILEREAIEKLIPHRPPMLLVDRVLSQDNDCIRCEKTYRPAEFFLQGHYPDLPVVPGVILCESALQSGALLLALRGIGGEGVPVVTRMDGIRLKRMVRPGETLEFAVQIDQTVPPAFYLSAKITSSGKSVARLEFACTLVRQLEAETTP